MNLLQQRPRLRFSLRSLLVAMTLLALFLSCHLHWIAQRRAMITSGAVAPVIGGPKDPPRAPGLLFLFGEPGYAALTEGKYAGANYSPGGYVILLRPATSSDQIFVRAHKLFPEARYLAPFFDDEPPLPTSPATAANEEDNPQLLNSLPQLPIDLLPESTSSR